MKKRFFCMILALVLMFTLLPCSVFAEGEDILPPEGEITEPNTPDTPNVPDVPDEQATVYPELKIILVGESGKKLEGGRFVLKDAKDSVIEEWSTDGSGEFQIDCTADGEYVLEQIASHDWYEVGAENKWHIVISDSGMTVSLARYNENGEVEAVAAATATADSPASFTVTNTKKYGNLVIGKSVSYEKDGTAAETADWTDADEEEAYKISVTLFDENNNGFTGTVSGAVFTDGTAVIALKDTDSVLLEQIPYGSKYTVAAKTENAEAVIAADNGEGILAAAETAVTVSYSYRFVTGNDGFHALWVNAEDHAQTITDGKAALLNSDGDVIGECETDADGKIHFDIPEEGTYTLTETQTPAGYFANSTIAVLTAAKETAVVEGVTEERMVITADTLEAAADMEGVYLIESAPIKPVTVSVNAVWEVPEGFTAIPESVEVQLYRNGSAYGDPVTLNAENNWRFSWSGAAFTNAYTWDVAQTEVPEGYTEAVITEDGYAFSVVNELEYSNVTVSVSKTWLNPKDYDKQPASVKVVLYRNGVAYETVTLGETYGWTYRWRNLPNCFVWTVDEPTVPENYKKKITHVGNAWVIVNAHEEIPLTGDDSHVGLWAGATVAALAGLGACAFLLLKKRKDNDE